MNMKPLPLILVCLCAQSAAGLAAQDLSSTNRPAPADDPAQQANAKLQDASSPQDYQQAAALLEQAVQRDPGNLDAREKLGWVYLDRLHQPQKAYPHLVIVAKNRPDEVNAHKLLGMACSQTGRSQRAVQEFQIAAHLQPNDLWIRAQLARSLARTGQWSQADEIYAGILKTDPNNADARFGEAEIAAWRGHNAAPLKTLEQLSKENPENMDAVILHGDIQRWNWDLTGARQDYQQVLATEPDNYVAENGLEEADRMGDSHVGLQAYQFKDTTHFRREDLTADGRVHLTDHAYLLGDVAGWRFTNPGFSDLNRRDGGVGLEYHVARWLEASGGGTVFDYDKSGSRAYFGGQGSIKISPITGTDLYLNGAYNQPFVSSINTVESSMRQRSIGAGLDTRLIGRFSLQAEAQGAKLSDNNKWVEFRPDLSYRLFDKPETFLRVEYDYLDYSRTNALYWTPQHRSTVGPVLDTSIPICRHVQFNIDAKAPYVFDESSLGVQVEGGPVIDFFNHVQAKASYYYSSIPGDQGAWSGQGWQASLQVRF